MENGKEKIGREENGEEASVEIENSEEADSKEKIVEGESTEIESTEADSDGEAGTEAENSKDTGDGTGRGIGTGHIWNRKTAALLCGIIALAAVSATVWQLAVFYGEEARSEQKMAQIRKVPLEDSLSDSLGNGENAVSEHEEDGTPGEENTPPEENPYRELFEQNEDMAAWLRVEGTKIDYPVMQTMEDENYYLKRDFNGDADEAGCLILDTDSDLQGTGTTNLIIHGHNMKAGTMFGELDCYKDEDYYRTHKSMELYLETEKRQYEVIAAFYSQVYYPDEQVFKYYDFFQADNVEDFDCFYSNIKEMSLYDTGVTAEFGDCFLTLSTCAYHVEDGRFVVVARETDRQEPAAR